MISIKFACILNFQSMIEICSILAEKKNQESWKEVRIFYSYGIYDLYQQSLEGILGLYDQVTPWLHQVGKMY